MSAFENIVIGKNSIPSLIITIILMIAIPVCFFLYWRRKHKEETKIRWLIAGAVGFVISARVLELGVHYFCIIADNPVSRFINGNALAFVLYGITMAGVFEECGRHIILKHIMKKNRTRENAVMYGIGHGGIEILAVLLPPMITCLAVAVLFSRGDTENALRTLNITEETAAAALPSVQAAAAFDYGMMAMNLIERLFALLFHIGLTVIVFYGVVNARKACLPLAILLHMLMDTFPALYQRGLAPLWAVEVWAAAWAVVVVFIAGKLYGKMKESSRTESVLFDPFPFAGANNEMLTLPWFSKRGSSLTKHEKPWKRKASRAFSCPEIFGRFSRLDGRHVFSPGSDFEVMREDPSRLGYTR